MKYYFKKDVDYSFEKTIERIKEELLKEKLGMVAEVNVQKIFKHKMDIDYKKYIILEFCNAPIAHKLIEAENSIGIFLPCNVVVQEISDNKTKVFFVAPSIAMSGIDNNDNDEIRLIIEQVQNNMKNAFNNL